VSIFHSLLIDTNAFRYLDDLGFLDICLDAIENPLTLDLIRDIELQKPCWKDVACHGVGVLGLDGKMMAAANAYMSKCKGLSIYDSGLIILGQVYGYPVFTEDKKMIRELSLLKVKHVSLLEVIDALVSNDYISCDEGIAAVDKISSELLSGRYDDECARLHTRFDALHLK